MTKQEFVNNIQLALNGKVSPSQVIENVRFYENYINTEIQKGKTEAEVMESLGDPRLIAKTIIQTSGYSGGSAEEGTYRNVDYDDRSRNGRRQTSYYETFEETKGKSRMPGWFWIIITILSIILIISIIFSVVSFLFPIIIPIILVVFLIKLFRDWLN